MTKKKYIDLKVKELPNSEIEIIAAIPSEELDAARAQAIQNLSKTAKIDGFRKGHVPEQVILKNYSEGQILDQAAQKLVQDVYPSLVLEENLQVIGHPIIRITKLALGNNLEFSVTSAIMPNFELADYKKIAKKEFAKKDDLEVTDKDVDDVLNHVRMQRAQIDAIEEQKKAGVEKPEVPEVDKDKLPELDDDFVATLGDFKSVDDFKKKVRENVKTEKEMKAKDKKRVATIEAVIEKTKLELPAILAEYELDKIQSQFQADVAQTGTKVEDYLKQIDKTIEDLRSDWREEAEKRAKLQLILNKIASENDIKADQERVEAELKHILEHYKDADESNVRVYVETSLVNEAVMQFLEESSVK